MRVDIFHHFPEGHDDRIDRILAALARIEQKENQIMATVQQFADALNRIDVATTRIGADIQALLAQIAAGGLTDAQETQALADIGARAAALEAMADSVENPVPPLPPPVTP